MNPYLYSRKFTTDTPTAPKTLFPASEDELAELETYRRSMEEELKDIDTKIQELKKTIEGKKSTS